VILFPWGSPLAQAFTYLDRVQTPSVTPIKEATPWVASFIGGGGQSESMAGIGEPHEIIHIPLISDAGIMAEVSNLYLDGEAMGDRFSFSGVRNDLLSARP
jgi:hypothetical protein